MKLQSVDVKTLSPDVFRVFGTQNALLTAGDRDKCNTMTIGWCQLGCVWNLPTCTVYVRPERYTYQFMESHDYFKQLEGKKRMTAEAFLCGVSLEEGTVLGTNA